MIWDDKAASFDDVSSMARAAVKMIAPLTIQTLARNPVALDLWEEGNGWQPGHIELADRADLLLIAPAMNPNPAVQR